MKKESEDVDCFKFKNEMLRRWGLPVKQDEAKDPSKLMKNGDEDPRHKFMNMTTEEQ